MTRGLVDKVKAERTELQAEHDRLTQLLRTAMAMVNRLEQKQQQQQQQPEADVDGVVSSAAAAAAAAIVIDCDEDDNDSYVSILLHADDALIDGVEYC